MGESERTNDRLRMKCQSLFSVVYTVPSIRERKLLKYSTWQYKAIKKSGEYSKLHHLSKQLIIMPHQTCTWHRRITYYWFPAIWTYTENYFQKHLPVIQNDMKYEESEIPRHSVCTWNEAHLKKNHNFDYKKKGDSLYLCHYFYVH